MAEMPTKCVSTVATIGVEAQLVFIDFEGRTDGMSLKILLSQIKPRQLVSRGSVSGQLVVSRWSVSDQSVVIQWSVSGQSLLWSMYVWSVVICNGQSVGSISGQWWSVRGK